MADITRPDDRPEWFWELAIAVNAAIKGILGSMGQSGNICGQAYGVPGEIEVGRGWPEVRSQLVELAASHLRDGDVMVVPDKVIAAALGRLGPRRLLLEPDPKTVPANDLSLLASRWEGELGFPVTEKHLLLADEYGTDASTVGTDDPNRRCAELAEAVRTVLGRQIDVVISDTDTGLDIRSSIIGTLTIGATPIGASAGVNLYEAMRCAVAAEFVRGHNRRIPVVVCRPAERRRNRGRMGWERAYAGFLDAAQEPGLAYA